MNFFSFFVMELKRVFSARTTWLVIALSVCAPLAGYSWYMPAVSTTKASSLIANPVMTGALAGAVLFALLTLYELNRVHKSETSALTDTIVSPLTLNGARVLALMAPAAVSVLIAIAVYLPYTVLNMKNIFSMSLFFASFFILMLPSLIFGILIAATLYQITRRVDLSFVLYTVLVLLSLNKWFADDFILRWVNPLIPIYSDDFSNIRILRMAAYNRLFWVLVLAGAYLLSIICIRRYGKGIFGSLRQNAKKVYFPILTFIFVAGGCFTYIYQPFIDHSPIDFVQAEETFNENMFLKSNDVNISLNTKKGTMQGKAVYEIENNNTQPQECKFQLNPGYEIRSVKVNDEDISFTDLNNDVNNRKEISITIPAEPELTLSIEYGGFPQEWSMSRNFIWGNEVSDRYVQLSNVAFSPILSVPKKMKEIPINGKITLPGDMTIISMGDTAKLVSENNDGTRTWLVSDSNGRTMTIYAGDYIMEVIDAAGMNIEFYYSRKHEDVMKQACAKQTMTEVVEYCAEHYGALPFTKDRPLKIIQTSAYQQGGGAFGNISVMGESYFSDEHLNDPDSQEGASSSEILAHEITHQWWGLGVMMYDEGPWSSEGLTVYTTYRMVKEKYGEEYAKKYYVDEWKQGLDALNRSFYHRHPEYLEILPEKYVSMINAQEWSTQRYQIMPLNILKTAELLGGEDKLDAVLSQLYQNGGTEMPPYITYNDFLNACGLTKEEISVD